MKKSAIYLLVLLSISFSSFGDYLFPSPNPPGGKSPSEVNQYMVISWEESGYSGKLYTQYEDTQNPNYSNSSWVGGAVSEGGSIIARDNAFNLSEGDIGLSWASRTLSGLNVYLYPEWNSSVDYSIGDTVIFNDTLWCARFFVTKGGDSPVIFDTLSYPGWNDLAAWQKNDILTDYPWDLISPVDKSLNFANPDGSPIHFTFSINSGFFVSTWPNNWQNRESKFGYWVPDPLDYPDGYNPTDMHSKIPVSWGRENEILDAVDGNIFCLNYIKTATTEAIDAGHEIANFTIDGMSAKSPLTKSSGVFAAWGGEGADIDAIDSVPGYKSFKESDYFGHREGATVDNMGWRMYAGQDLSQTGWKGILNLSSDELELSLDINISKNNLFGFTAPGVLDVPGGISNYIDNSRHINSQLFYALKDLNYEYDNSVEHGWDSNRDSTNLLWPFTTDNGLPWNSYAKKGGIRSNLDSLPVGVWEIPNNVLIVPPTIRQAVYDKRKAMNDVAPMAEPIETFNEWVASGAKISASDVSAWIVNGMTADEWLTTMKYNLLHRKNNNKAPMHYRGQTKVYTPMMDFIDLTSGFLKASYGQVYDNGWSTYATRIDAMEQFVEWAITNDIYFVSAHELIQKVKAMQVSDVVGTIIDSAVDTTSWIQYAIRSDSTQNFRDTTIGDSMVATFTVYDDCVEAGFRADMGIDSLKSIDHISFVYKTNVPLELTILLENGDVWIAALNNLHISVNSGLIPITAFEPKGHVVVDSLDISQIKELYFNIVNVYNKTIAADIKIKNFKTYSTLSELPNVTNFNAEQATTGGDSVRIDMTWEAPVASDVDSIIVLWKMHEDDWDYSNQEGQINLGKGATQTSLNVINTDTTIYFNIFTRDKDNPDLQWSTPYYDTVKITNTPPKDITFSASKSLNEDDTVGTLVGVFKTLDDDLADSSFFRYSLSDTSVLFFIDSVTGSFATKTTLKAGNHLITIKSKDFYGDSISKDFTISVTSTGIDTYKFTKVDASDSSSSYHAENDNFGINAATKPDSADVIYKFSKWTGDTAYLNSTLSESTTVTMPAESIIVIAQYEIYNYKPTSIAFNGTSIKGDADSSVFVGKLSTIDNDSNEYFVYSFIGDSGHFSINKDSVLLSKPFDSTFYNNSVGFKILSTDSKGSSVSDSFTVSILDPTLPTYMLVLNYGTESDTGYYNSGATVNVSAKKLTNKKFKEWIGSIENITDGSKSDSSIVITIPATNITLTATYTQLYILLVENGSKSGLYEKDTDVTVIAENKIGESFIYWSGDVGNISDSLNDTITVTIPDSNITITANYVKLTQLTVENGSGSGFYKQDTSITIIANQASLGQVFEKWIGSTKYLSDSLNDTTMITIPDTSVYLKAIYKNTTVTTLLSKIITDSVIGADDFVFVSQQWDSSANGFDVYPINELAPYSGSRPNITVVGDSIFDYKDLSSFTSLCYYFAKNRKIKSSNQRSYSNLIDLTINRIGNKINIDGVLSEETNIAGCLVKVHGLPGAKITKNLCFFDNEDVLNFEYQDFNSVLRISSRLNDIDNVITTDNKIFEIKLDDLPVPLNKVIIEYELVNDESYIVESGRMDITNNLKNISNNSLDVNVVPNPSVVTVSYDNFIISNDIVDPENGFNFYIQGIKENELVETIMSISDHSGNIIIQNRVQLDSDNNFIYWNGSLKDGRSAGIGAYIVNFECKSQFREDKKQILIGIKKHNN